MRVDRKWVKGQIWMGKTGDGKMTLDILPSGVNVHSMGKLRQCLLKKNNFEDKKKHEKSTGK